MIVPGTKRISFGTMPMDDIEKREPVLAVRFYRTASGQEPVREWLLALGDRDRKTLGRDIKTAQFGWPLGMPLVRKLEPGLWEVRSHLSAGIARVMFTVEGSTMVLLHAFAKKSQKTPLEELAAARHRLALLREAGVRSKGMNTSHIGSDFDEFLEEHGLLEDAQAVAAKRVIAFQIAQEMERNNLTKSEMAQRMRTSRPAGGPAPGSSESLGHALDARAGRGRGGQRLIVELV